MALHLDRMFGPGRPSRRARRPRGPGDAGRGGRRDRRLSEAGADDAAGRPSAGRARDQAALRARALAGRGRRAGADATGRSKPRAADGAPALFLSVWAQRRARDRLLPAPRLRRWSAMRPSPLGTRIYQRSGDAARPDERRGDPRRRAGRRAARLPRPAGRRLDGRLRRPQRRPGLGRRPRRRSPRIAAAPSRRWRPARGWSPSTRSIRPTRSTRPRPGPTTPARMPTRWSPTGPASRSASSPPIARRCCSPTARPA